MSDQLAAKGYNFLEDNKALDGINDCDISVHLCALS
jgi:hypothetical protein